MATVQKTTLKRYNGTDWDPVYLANSADISYLGKGFSVAAGEGFTMGQNISASENMADLMATVINNLTAIDKTKIPALANGTSITELDVSKLKGIIARTNLPADVGGKAVEVATEEEKTALTKADVNIGDLVKVTNGKVYSVTAVDPTVTYMELTDSASEIAWSRITSTPTTLTGYGITDAIAATEKVTEAKIENAGKILVLNAAGKLDVDVTGDAATLGGNAPTHFATAQGLTDANTAIGKNTGNITTLQQEIKAIDAAWITTGTIDIARLPATAVERLYVAADEDALAALTTTQVQNGDTVKVATTGKMYFVIDDTKLGTADFMNGLTEYSAGVAGSVDWSGVLNKPTTLVDYGITDAVAASEKVDAAGIANAGKVMTVGADGKLHGDITGDAATLGGHAADYFATAQSVTDLSGVVGNAEGGLVKDVTALKSTVGDAASGLVKDVADLKTDMGTAKTDITNLKNGTAITALAASKLTGTVARANLPADISGRLFAKATLDEAFTSLTPETAGVGDLVKLTDGKVYVITDTANLDNAAGYTCIVDVAGTAISWNKLTDIPTSLAAMNWTDAVTTAMLVDQATVANQGKLLKIGADGKLNASITGDAATLGGQAPAYYATKTEHDGVAGRVATAEGKVSTLETEIKAIDAAWITTGVISIDRLPHGALERCTVVANKAARMALTTAQVQTGDTVKEADTGLMYFVVDETKLGTDAAFEVYTAGTASAVDWSGVQSKPTTLAGYGITDAVAATEKVTVASAANVGKILVLNADGKLDVDITGHVEWANINGAPTSTVAQIDAAVTAATHTNRAVLDLLNVDTDGHLTYDGAALAYKSELDNVALGSLQVVDALPADAASGQLVLEAIA